MWILINAKIEKYRSNRDFENYYTLVIGIEGREGTKLHMKFNCEGNVYNLINPCHFGERSIPLKGTFE